MTTTNSNKLLLDLPKWEPLGLPLITGNNNAVVAGAHWSWSWLADNLSFKTGGSSGSTPELFVYNAADDSFVFWGTTGTSGTLSTGAAMVVTTRGPSGVVFANGNASGTTLSIQETLRAGLTGYYILVYRESSGFHELRKISTNNQLTNSTITVETAFSRQITTSDSYRIFSPRIYACGAVSTASNSFRYYDWATQSWTDRAVMPVATTNASQLISTPSFIYDNYKDFASGTATGGGATTLDNSAKTWTTNQWTNSLIVITAGTGAGQERLISSNTGTQITVSSAWTVNPDNTSQYKICASDNFIYFLPSNSTVWYRYNVSSNTWQTSPTGIANLPSTGSARSTHWIWNVSHPSWNNESNIKNGRFLYSRISANTARLDVYDIALNSWSLAPSVAPSGSQGLAADLGCYIKNKIYFKYSTDTRKIVAFDLLTEQFSSGCPMTPSGTSQVTVNGQSLFTIPFRDGATEIPFLYSTFPGSTLSTTPLFRMMVLND